MAWGFETRDPDGNLLVGYDQATFMLLDEKAVYPDRDQEIHLSHHGFTSVIFTVTPIVNPNHFPYHRHAGIVVPQADEIERTSSTYRINVPEHQARDIGRLEVGDGYKWMDNAGIFVTVPARIALIGLA